MKEGDVMTEDGRLLTPEQAQARQKVWRAHEDGVGVTLGDREVKALYETLMDDARVIRDPEASLKRAIQHLRSERKSEEQIIDLVRKIVAETIPMYLGVVRAGEAEGA
jgi:hypothetical protein